MGGRPRVPGPRALATDGVRHGFVIGPQMHQAEAVLGRRRRRLVLDEGVLLRLEADGLGVAVLRLDPARHVHPPSVSGRSGRDGLSIRAWRR